MTPSFNTVVHVPIQHTTAENEPHLQGLFATDQTNRSLLAPNQENSSPRAHTQTERTSQLYTSTLFKNEANSTPETVPDPIKTQDIPQTAPTDISPQTTNSSLQALVNREVISIIIQLVAEPERTLNGIVEQIAKSPSQDVKEMVLKALAEAESQFIEQIANSPPQDVQNMVLRGLNEIPKKVGISPQQAISFSPQDRANRVNDEVTVARNLVNMAPLNLLPQFEKAASLPVANLSMLQGGVKTLGNLLPQDRIDRAADLARKAASLSPQHLEGMVTFNRTATEMTMQTALGDPQTCTPLQATGNLTNIGSDHVMRQEVGFERWYVDNGRQIPIGNATGLKLKKSASILRMKAHAWAVIAVAEGVIRTIAEAVSLVYARIFRSQRPQELARHREVLRAQWQGLTLSLLAVLSPNHAKARAHNNGTPIIGAPSSNWTWGTAYTGKRTIPFWHIECYQYPQT